MTIHESGRSPDPSAADDHDRNHERDALIRAHLPLAQSLARRYVGRGESYEDLTQVARLGLVKAAGRYDSERGASFAHYGSIAILGELKRHFRDTRWGLHVARRAQEQYLLVGAATGWATEDLGRTPTVAEIAEWAGLTETEVLAAQAISACFYIVSATPADADDGGAGVDEQSGQSDRAFSAADDRLSLAVMLRGASESDRQLLWMRFGAELTQAEIAKRLGISQMHVSRLLSKALRLLRQRCVNEVTGSAVTARAVGG